MKITVEKTKEVTPNDYLAWAERHSSAEVAWIRETGADLRFKELASEIMAIVGVDQSWTAKLSSTHEWRRFLRSMGIPEKAVRQSGLAEVLNESSKSFLYGWIDQVTDFPAVCEEER
jgi:hypothetical protein